MAELIAGSAAGFVGFEAVSSALTGDKWGAVEQVQETKPGDQDPANYGASVEFQVVMKQLGKRDTTTKLKALQEFTSLCQRESLESVQSVLTVWSLMYNKLSLDNDHRVREASHKALKSCVERAKATLGPHVRGIIGCWVSGMCDPHSPAALGAQAAFTAAFPSNKQRNVYEHGFKSVLKHVEDIVLKESVDTFSDPKVVPEDERVQRYERAVAMSLFGLSLTLNQLSGDFLEENNELWTPLLSENRLWKLNKHQNPSIRAAIYTLVFTTCKTLPAFVKSRAKHFCTLVLGSLGENDPSVAGVVWEAGLTVIATVETWSEHINVQKALLPGLWSLLNAGGYGSARIAYKFLLPLLSKLVDQIFATDVNFAKSFLEKLSSGVEAERVRNMRSDCEIVMDTYVDCFLYFFNHVRLNDPERGAFQEDLAKMVVDLSEYAIVRCPPVPFDAVNSAVVRIVSRVLTAQKGDTSFSFWTACFQQRLSVRLAEIVTHSPSDKEQLLQQQFSRINELLTQFSKDATGPKGSSSHCVTDKTDIEMADSDADRQQLVEYLAPVVSSLCAVCITKLLSTKSLQHSRLLSQALPVYGGRVVSTLARRMFPGDWPVHLGASKTPISVPHDCRPDEQECLALATGLLATINLEDLVSEDELYLESVVETVAAVLCCEVLSVPTALKYVEQVIRYSPPVMPLMVLKLVKSMEQAHIITLLTNLQDNVLLILSEGTHRKVPHMWQFVSFILQELADALKGPVIGSVFRKLCQLINEGLNQLEKSRLEELFKALESVHPLVVQNNQDVRSDLNDLLVCLLHWSVGALNSTEMGQKNDRIRSVIRCFRHLLNIHPGLSMWLKTASEMIISKGITDIEKVLLEAFAFFVLHCEILQTLDAFRSAYSSIVFSLQRPKVQTLPLLALELFCSAKMLYMPLPASEDLLTTSVVDTIPSSLVHVVWLAVALSDANVLEGLVSKEPDIVKDEGGSHWFNRGGLDPSVLFGKVEDEEGMSLWKDLMILFLQGLAYLQSSQVKEHNGLEHEHELLVRTIVESALERALGVGVRRRQWIRSLLVAILRRPASDRLLWLRILFAEFERILVSEYHTSCTGSCEYDSETVSMREVISMISDDSDGSVLVAALGGLHDPALYASELLHIEQVKPDDLQLAVGCMMLSPTTRVFQQAAIFILKGLSTQHNSSDSTLFESVEESSSNSFSLLTLLLIREVLLVELIPSEAWDFVLCTLVSLCQLLMEAMGGAATVNMAVFQCVVMELCCLTSQYFHSPTPRLDLHTEWMEFFQPALQNSLLPLFLRYAASSPGKDFGFIYQRYSLSKAVVALCKKTDNVSLEELVQILLSNFYSFQSAACILAKRYLEAAEISVSDEENASQLGKVSLMVGFFKSVFGAALDKIDLEHVFLEGNHTSPPCKTGTTSYLFLWYLILQAMGRCSPEARALVSEWLKELTLFDHLLHGLFNYLSDSTMVAVKDEMIEVSLNPAMETLACSVYVAVAKQLPFMLRQWHNSLDRQTSAMVSRFTSRIVSPVLQQAELERKYNSVEGNMETRVCAGASEVSVTYRVDECCIELWVSLPESYPLQPPSIREGKRVRIDQAQWRKWMLQLNVFVANQNGSLWDGLALWKSNLDKHFAGVEDCMICFSVIHASNYSLPKMSCRTCKKRFHNACLIDYLLYK
eukprot:Em0011g584a